MSDIEVTMVPKDLYYHEVAYVRGLEKKNAELVAALEKARGWLGHAMSDAERDELYKQIDAALAAGGHKQ